MGELRRRAFVTTVFATVICMCLALCACSTNAETSPSQKDSDAVEVSTSRVVKVSPAQKDPNVIEVPTSFISYTPDLSNSDDGSVIEGSSKLASSQYNTLNDSGDIVSTKTLYTENTPLSFLGEQTVDWPRDSEGWLAGSSNREFDDEGRLLSVVSNSGEAEQTYTFSYDENGHLRSRDVRTEARSAGITSSETMEWDADGLLVSYESSSSSSDPSMEGSHKRATYSYQPGDEPDELLCTETLLDDTNTTFSSVASMRYRIKFDDAGCPILVCLVGLNVVGENGEEQTMQVDNAIVYQVEYQKVENPSPAAQAQRDAMGSFGVMARGY